MSNDVARELPAVAEVLKQYAKVIDPVSRRRTWTASRLAVKDDGSTVPVLHVLAIIKYGTWDLMTQYPYWIDKDWKNETYDNVGLVDLTTRSHRQRSAYGVPSGTSQYWAVYRDRNREKIQAYHRKRYVEAKNAVVQLAKLKEQGTDLGSVGDLLSKLGFGAEGVATDEKL